MRRVGEGDFPHPLVGKPRKRSNRVLLAKNRFEGGRDGHTLEVWPLVLDALQARPLFVVSLQ